MKYKIEKTLILNNYRIKPQYNIVDSLAYLSNEYHMFNYSVCIKDTTDKIIFNIEDIKGFQNLIKEILYLVYRYNFYKLEILIDFKK